METISATKEQKRQLHEGGKFLSFFLGEEEYAIEILKVQEIIGLLPITPVPRMPDYVRGILNLRGSIVPIMCLRRRFGLHDVEDTTETCIIVVEADGQHSGIVVDKVSEVVDVTVDQIEDVPDFGHSVKSEFLKGVAKSGNRVRMLVNISEIVGEGYAR